MLFLGSSPTALLAKQMLDLNNIWSVFFAVKSESVYYKTTGSSGLKKGTISPRISGTHECKNNNVLS